MEGGASREIRRRCLRSLAQATIEFAFSAPLLLLCLFASIDAAAWSLQNSAAVAAVEEGARLAASAPGSPLGQSAPNAAQVTDGVIKQLQTAMFATSIRPWCGTHSAAACAAAACPHSPDAVEASLGPRVVVVCVREQRPSPCNAAVVAPYCGDPPTITVRVIGFMASLVPPSFGLGWHGGEIPLDVSATTHTLRFAS